MDLSRELLKLLRRTVGGELSRRRRRRGSAPLIIAVLVVVGFGIDRLLDRPQAPAPGRGASLVCGVTSVYDGDTATLNCPDGELKVRVWGIDTPEIRQAPWGRQSRDALRARMPGDVRVEVLDTDRYGRSVARLYDGQQDLGLSLVRDGQAAVYRQYNDSALYRQAEDQARRERKGIWSEPGAQQTPWEWRKLNP